MPIAPNVTRQPGVLTVVSVLPDPPFEFPSAASPAPSAGDGLASPSIAGFDVDLMRGVGRVLGFEVRRVTFDGADFNRCFDGLARGDWDCVASGATITPQREQVALFCAPYLESGQSLVVNVERTPKVRSIDDLAEQIIAVQKGNTSEPVVEKLLEAGRVREVRRYAYHDIGTMLDDLERGVIGAVMKLAPVMHWLTRGRRALRVVQERITNERLGVAVALGNDALRTAIDSAQESLRADGTMDALIRRWITP